MRIEQYDDMIDVGLGKARAFFTRAEEVATTDNFDYAIDLYLDGLKLAPDALEDGHAPLRKLALIRQGKGLKKASMVDQLKHSGGKTPLEQMLNAEYLLAKDPDNLTYAEKFLKACLAQNCKRTAEWIAQLLFDANRAAAKPSFERFLLLKDSYAKLGLFEKAVSACDFAMQLKPENDNLRQELRDLSAQMTINKGNYAQATSFRESIKDKDYQDNLQSQDNVVRSEAVRQKAVDDAKKRLQSAPASVTNILQLADALAEQATPQAYQDAVELLKKSYQASRDFTFQRKLGELEIAATRRQIRDAQESGDASQAGQIAELNALLDKQELEHYQKCVDNYPTDLRLKYEYGVRLIKAQQFDQAIPLLQEARSEPRLRQYAMDKIGLCFLLKGWMEDAIDMFTEALKECQLPDSPLGKDIRYNLARAYEEFKQPHKALEIYRKLAQADFNYKDTSQRIDKLRSQCHNT